MSARDILHAQGKICLLYTSASALASRVAIRAARGSSSSSPVESSESRGCVSVGAAARTGLVLGAAGWAAAAGSGCRTSGTGAADGRGWAFGVAGRCV